MSLKKIAEMVGTSPSTVSRVLNHTSETCASKDLSRRIWEAAQEIGYRPNESARSLRRGGAQGSEPLNISVVMARFHELAADPFFEDLLDCLKRELFAQDALLNQVIYDEAEISQIKSSDGVVILGRCSGELLDSIRKKTRYVVGIWRNSMYFDVDEVLCDGRKAAEMAMEHLYSLVHRKIEYIGDCSHESSYVGYCNSL
ncbi:MAG: LacI family transcriptional regulator, partial [Clostridiales bacterium]|nr:LacI family transcriptional regulator [Clostridiales bacterium]